MTEFLDLSKGMFNQPGFLDLSADEMCFFPRIKKKQDPAKTVAGTYALLDSERLNELTVMGA